MSKICDDLRAAILQAAMQGKLTRQLPEDGDAEELLKKIYDSKSDDKKTKKLSDITNEDMPFEIPENWRWIRAGFICNIISGTSYSSKDITSDGIRIYRGGNVIDGGLLVDLEGDVRIKKQLADEEKRVKQGDVVIVASTGSQKVIGKPCLVKNNNDGYIGAFLRILRATDLIMPEYFWCYIRSDLYRDAIRARAVGTNINNVKTEYIAENVFPLPPLAEQKRIVEKVDELMARVTDLEKSADALASLKKSFSSDIKASLLQYAMQGKLTKQLPEDGNAEDLLTHRHDDCSKKHKSTAISENEKPFSIPSTWQWIRIGDFFETITGGTPSKTHSEYYGGDYAFFKPSDLDAGKYITDTSEYLTEAGRMVSRQLPANTILICCIGSIGKVAIMGIEGTTNQQINAILPNDSVDIEYLYYAIKSPVFFEKIWSLASSTTISIVNKSKMDSIIIPLPPLAEQKRIVERLNSLMQNINAVGELIASE